MTRRRSSIRCLVGIIVAAVTAALVAACASPYVESYQDMRQTTMADVDFEPFSGAPRLVQSSGDPKLDVYLQLDDGYAVIGVSGFFGDPQNPDEVLQQAKEVGAAVVLIGAKYRDSETTETSYIRYSVDRFERWALYLAPLPRKGLGILFDRMTERQRREAGSDRGVQVVAIRKASPAARSNIVIGDVILTIDGHEVEDVATLRKAVDGALGRDAAIELVRDGTRIATTVDLRDW
ncbi:MAG: PDZ domain-containing protein [Alphaproteobacteria bacterium]